MNNEYKDFINHKLDEIESRIKEANQSEDEGEKCMTLEYISGVSVYIGLDYNMINVKRFIRLVNDFFAYSLYPVELNQSIWISAFSRIESILADQRLYSLKCLRNINVDKLNRTEFEDTEEASPLICLQNCAAYFATLYSINSDWYNLSKTLETVIDYTKKNIEYVFMNSDCERLLRMNHFNSLGFYVIGSEYWFEPLSILYHEALSSLKGSYLAIAHEQIYRYVCSLQINDKSKSLAFLKTKDLFRQRCRRMYRNVYEDIELDIELEEDESHKKYLIEKRDEMYQKYQQYGDDGHI